MNKPLTSPDSRQSSTTDISGTAVEQDAPDQQSTDNIAISDQSPTTAGNADQPAREIGGQKGPEPTRYGDWEKNGRCTDF